MSRPLPSALLLVGLFLLCASATTGLGQAKNPPPQFNITSVLYTINAQPVQANFGTPTLPAAAAQSPIYINQRDVQSGER